MTGPIPWSGGGYGRGVSTLTELLCETPPFVPADAEMMVVTMLCAPGQPMLTYVDDDELAQRRDRRAPRP